ncbi:FGGY family carbohydrate kinase, partial [Gangjinia marincola]
MSKPYLLSLDQGTTSSRSILFDRDANIVSKAQQDFTQIFPKPGWVEHDPVEIWESQLATIRNVINDQVSVEDIAALGITNQRETVVIWDKTTGEPIYNAIVWQDRRTAAFCDDLKAQGKEELIQRKTGLVIDAYFSASKIAWMLNHVDGARAKAEKGELCFGTIDTWLIYQL